jgi:Ca2+-binding RTX toxin-like protein
MASAPVTTLRLCWVLPKKVASRIFLRLHGTIRAMLRRTKLAACAAAVVLLSGATSTAAAVEHNGGPGKDVFRGTPQKDTLRGKGGDDRLFGFAGEDLLLGGPGDDLIKGGPAHDEIGGGSGDDRLIAGRDPQLDRVYGSGGNDMLFVRGKDLADAGRGNDEVIATDPTSAMEIFCGPGEDKVVFNEETDAETFDCEQIKIRPLR